MFILLPVWSMENFRVEAGLNPFCKKINMCSWFIKIVLCFILSILLYWLHTLNFTSKSLRSLAPTTKLVELCGDHAISFFLCCVFMLLILIILVILIYLSKAWTAWLVPPIQYDMHNNILPANASSGHAGWSGAKNLIVMGLTAGPLFPSRPNNK